MLSYPQFDIIIISGVYAFHFQMEGGDARWLKKYKLIADISFLELLNLIRMVIAFMLVLMAKELLKYGYPLKRTPK